MHNQRDEKPQGGARVYFNMVKYQVFIVGNMSSELTERVK
jgi:hypothetical protein